MAPRKKYSILSVEDKKEILKLVEEKVPTNTILRQYQISESTLYNLKRNQNVFEEKLTKFNKNAKIEKRKRFREPKFPLLDAALHAWFIQKRHQGFPISGPMLQEKARIFHSKLYPGSAGTVFNSSAGFLRNFKERYQIKEKTLKGEKLSADMEAAEKYVNEQFSKDIEGFDVDCIYNADEFGLNYKALPEKSLNNSEVPAEVCYIILILNIEISNIVDF